MKHYAALLIKDKEHDELVGRINADNFIILRHYNSRAELTKRQSAVDAAIRDYMRSHLDRQALSICCGICCLEDVDEKLNLNELLNRANFARKMVKNGHELNNYCFYDESIRQHLLEEKSIESSMEEALSSRQFEVFYQPKVCMRTAEIAGSEALVRWRTQKGTLLMPDAIPDGLLEIEFTESVMFDNWERLTSIVDQLHSCGFACSIDDFGKGYSSLGMFKNLNVDVLKIDALFFHNLETEEKDRLLVESIIQLVRQFGVKTVAEGIETREQIEILKHMRCDYIQGYVYYKPMPQKEYEKLLLQLFPLCAQEAVTVCPV